MFWTDDPVVCLCGGITERAILAALNEGITDLPSVREATGANQGCGDCLRDIEELLGEQG
ncbi:MULTISPECIES: (2Fe-2S)-binding protein [Kitasatospora]|uniref:Bacterioferritin-associated ferredoxin n=1 Tax=Kitasatospora cystarginea TaxID=58350 RepID=A0ABP5QGD4_9ACTN